MKKILIFVFIGVFLVSFVSAGWFTGNAVWGWNHCSSVNPCPAGEGDCDKNSDCLTGYCHQNTGSKYGKSRMMDVCEEPANSSGSGVISSKPTPIKPPIKAPAPTVTYEGVLKMLGNCKIVNLYEETHKPSTGDQICEKKGYGYTCLLVHYDNQQDAFSAIGDCKSVLEFSPHEPTEAIQVMCCSAP